MNKGSYKKAKRRIKIQNKVTGHIKKCLQTRGMNKQGKRWKCLIKQHALLYNIITNFPAFSHYVMFLTVHATKVPHLFNIFPISPNACTSLCIYVKFIQTHCNLHTRICSRTRVYETLLIFHLWLPSAKL